MELLEDIARFIWAVMSMWQAYMTGGIVIASLGIYERITNKTISLRTFIIGVAAFLLVAFFMVWRDQYRARVDAEKNLEVNLVGSIDYVYATPVGSHTLVFVLMTITNKGAPSAVVGWRLSVKSNNFEVKDVPFAQIPDVFRVQRAEGDISAIFHGKECLCEKTVTQVQRGDFRAGYIAFAIDGDHASDIVSSGTTIAVSFKDYAGHVYSTKSDMTAKSNPPYMPGVEQPFISDPNKQMSAPLKE